MNLTKEQLEAIEQLAYRLIIPSLIAINLEVDETDFVHSLRIPGSPERTAFYRGFLRQTIETREAILKASRNGSNPAQTEVIAFMREMKNHLDHE
ncbi:MAG: hypothetical protein RR206_04880 [Bacteroidaceae bacterium]